MHEVFHFIDFLFMFKQHLDDIQKQASQTRPLLFGA